MPNSLSVKTLSLVFATCAFVLLAALSSAARTEQSLHSFNYSDGTNPHGGLILDAAGNLYGTTSQDGQTGAGTVYELLPNGLGQWGYETLYNFCSMPACADGLGPQAGLFLDSSGNLYGTTSMGGNSSNPNCGHGCGVVFELTSNNGFWTETVLYAFSGGSDGAAPMASLVMDSAGNLYGTTSAGGGTSPYCALGCGVLFTLQRGVNGTWTQKVLHAFCTVSGCVDGAVPNGLAFDGAGSLYCTTAQVGQYDGGTVIQLVPHANGKWSGRLVHSFGKGADGVSPNPGLAIDTSDYVYGTTNRGGQFNSGMAFELRLGAKGQWTEHLLHSFCSSTNCADGGLPAAGLTVDSSGHLFGTTSAGGTAQGGTLYALTQNPNGHWTETVLYNSFSGNLNGQVTLDPSENLFSTTSIGGNYNLGSVIEVVP
jgi:uncharacterized repeat protein (TIGR03803 family)